MLVDIQHGKRGVLRYGGDGQVDSLSPSVEADAAITRRRLFLHDFEHAECTAACEAVLQQTARPGYLFLLFIAQHV